MTKWNIKEADGRTKGSGHFFVEKHYDAFEIHTDEKNMENAS